MSFILDSIGNWIASDPFGYKGQSIRDFQADVAAGKWITLIERWQQFPPSDPGGKNRYIEPLTNQFNKIKGDLGQVEAWARAGWPPAQELYSKMALVPSSNAPRVGINGSLVSNDRTATNAGLIDVNSNNNNGFIVFALVGAVLLLALKGFRRG